MKIKVTTIDFEIPRRHKRIATIVAVPTLVLLGAAALAYAGVPNTFTPGQPLSSSQMNANFSALDARITTLETTPTVPSGTIVSFAGNSAPAGWVLCDGSQYDGTAAAYANLFGVTGLAYGGSGSMFNVPDLRGRFVRGFNNGAGRDPDAATRVASAAGGNTGDAIGSVESDAYAQHAHGVNDPGHAHTLGIQTWGLTGLGNSGAYAFGTNGNVNNNPPTNASGTGISIQAAGGSETRPINVYTNFIIKL